MRQPTRRDSLRTGIAILAVTILVAACGSGREGADELGGGVYEFELTEAYLRENGIPAEQAKMDAGVHEVTLAGGSVIDRWRAADGTVGSCVGVYVLEGTRAAFRWTRGCTGAWAMTYSLERNRIVWSDVELLEPDLGADEQRIAEVFNGVAWTRTADVRDVR